MKYIPTEKLIAEIEKRRKCCSFIADEKRNEDMSWYYHGKETAYYAISWLLTSLQQEQSEADFEDKFAKFIERKDAELGANSWSEDDLRELATYFYFENNKKMEADIEKKLTEQDSEFCDFYALALNTRKKE